MPTSTRKNGITLIALIITIIVMLILVGVTINVALNGGLFDKAKTASDGTQKEVDREALISAVIGTLNDDGTVNLTELQANLPDDFEYSNGIYTNTKNGKQYTVDPETGKVEENTSTPPVTLPIAGTYNSYITNVSAVKAIILNNDGQTGKLIVQNGNAEVEQSITYEYDESNNAVTLDDMNFNFKTIGNNKILLIFGNGMYMIYTTQGSSNIATLEGTYGEEPDEETFTTEGTFTNDNTTGKYCIIDNYMYTQMEGNFYKIDVTSFLQ